MTKTRLIAAFAAAAVVFVVPAASGQADTPAERITPAPDLLFETVAVGLRKGEMVSGQLAALDDDALYLIRPGGEVRLSRTEIKVIEIESPRRSREAILLGALSGGVIGWSAISHLLGFHSVKGRAELVASGMTLFVAAGVGVGFLVESDPLRRAHFAMTGREGDDAATWDRLKRFVQDKRIPSRLHFAFSGGAVPTPAGASVQEDWSRAGFRSSFRKDAPERSDPFLRMRLAFSLKPGLDIGAVVARMTEPEVAGTQKKIESPWIMDYYVHFRYRATGYFLTGIFRLGEGTPDRPLTLALGAGLGAVSAAAEISGTVYGLDSRTKEYLSLREDSCKSDRTALGGLVFAEGALRLSRRIKAGLSGEYIYGPKISLPPLSSLLVPSQTVRASGVRLGFVLEYGF